MTHTHPIAGIGAVVIYDKRVLLVKRAKPPKQGLWCIPGGKIRFGETLQQAAEREIQEETGIVIKAGAPIHAFDLIRADEGVHYVIIDVIAEYVSGDVNAADDAADARWFPLEQLLRDSGGADIEKETRALTRAHYKQLTSFATDKK